MAASRRHYIGLSIGRSGRDLEAALVETSGPKANLRASVVAGKRFGLAADASRKLAGWIWAEQLRPALPAEGLLDLAGRAVQWLLGESSLTAVDIEAVGWVAPAEPIEALGGALADRVGMDVVTGFGQSDRLVSGLGAMEAAWPVWKLAGDKRLSRVILRLGALGRMYFLGAGAHEVEVVAGDFGPGTCLIDWACREHFDLPCDRDGAVAGKATPAPALLNELLSHHWLQLGLPKLARPADWSGTYRKRVAMMADKQGVSAPDLVATLTEMTARLAARAVERMTEKPHQVVLVGGGAANITLAGRIRELLSPSSTVSAETLGVDGRTLRATAAGMLAAARRSGRRLWCPQATGAARPAILGTWIYTDKE
jgi:anhydro-N-acetylmuramic acid kinase